MPGLGRGEFQLGVQGQGSHEVVAAGALAPRRAVDERQVLVGLYLVSFPMEPLGQARLEAAVGLGVTAVFVVPEAGGQVRFTWSAPDRLDFPLDILYRLGFSACEQPRRDQRQPKLALHALCFSWLREFVLDFNAVTRFDADRLAVDGKG